jgi:hypothetical protein
VPGGACAIDTCLTGGFLSFAWAIDFALCITSQLKHGMCDGGDMGFLRGRGWMSDEWIWYFDVFRLIFRLFDY